MPMAKPTKDNPTRFDIELPPGLNKTQRDAIADAVIEHIRQRSEAGIANNGSKFPRYSKEYTESVDFKIGGKKKNKVDLTLSGDMLAALQVIKDRRDRLTIGYKKDTEEADKAEGNQLGTYGQPTPIKGKARPFLGFVGKERDKLRQLILDAIK